MRSKDVVKAALGALLMATMVYVILAAPGLLDDRARTVARHVVQEVRQ